MSVYMTEEEQLMALKKWWNKHQSIILLVLSVGLAIVAGYRYWTWHTHKVTQQASITYEQMMVAAATKDDVALQSHANRLISDYHQTVYGDVAHLMMARYFVEHTVWDKAKNELHTVISQSKRPALQTLARIRLARILFFEQAYPDALLELKSISDTVYAPVVHELKRNILLAKRTD